VPGKKDSNMVYNQEKTALTTLQPESLVSDSASLCNSLEEIRNRVVQIGDRLHGVRPREVGADGKPAPVPSLRQNLDSARRVASDIFDELLRVENNL
jgi:hypothetical protein